MESQDLSTPAKPHHAARGLDLSMAEDFLTTIDPKQRITYQTFDDNRKRKDQSLARIEYGPVSEYVDLFNSLAARGAGIYFCLCGTRGAGRRQEDVAVFRGFWVDLDGAPLDPVLKCTFRPSIVTETSPGRYHAFWLFEDFVHVDQLSPDRYATIQLKLASLFGGDPAVADPPHVARLPGSWHQKNPDAPFLVRVAHGDWEGLRYTVEDFERELAGVEVARRPSSTKPGVRKTGGDPAPSKEAAIACLRNIKNVPGSGFDDRGKFVGLVAGIEVMCAPFGGDDEVEKAKWDVYLAYPNDVPYVRDILDSKLDRDRGYTWVMKVTGQNSELAQIEFAEPLSIPEIACPAAVTEEAVLDRMFADNIYIGDLDRFLHVPTMRLRKPKAFCAAYAGLRGRKKAEDIFIKNTLRGRRHDNVTYRPGKKLIIPDEHPESGVTLDMVNLWVPGPLKPIVASDADVAPFLDHVRKHFPPPVEHDALLDWMAFIVQQAGVKINFSVAVIGEVEGTGKDAMFEPSRRILGEHNAVTVDAEDLRSQFNAKYLQKQLAIFNEVHGMTQAEVNRIKKYAAAPPHYLWVNQKNLPEYRIPNILNCVMLSNHLDALALGKHDRRHLVLHSRVDAPMTKADRVALWGWFDAGGCAKIFGWLKARNLGAFDQFERPPMTALKAEMIRSALPPPLRWCLALLEEGGPFESRTIITVSEILEGFERSRTAPRDVSHKWASGALKEAGFMTNDKLQVRLKDGAKRLWIKTSNPLLAQLKADQLRERYEAQRSGWGRTDADWGGSA